MASPIALELDDLTARFPLPAAVGVESFSETVLVSGVPIHLAGFAAEIDGECITGSAAEFGSPPVLRAYMELVERLSVLVAMRRKDTPATLRDAEGSRVGLAPASHVFPESPDASRWRWARSNGVAVAATWKEAAMRARWELIERDRILRSFYGEIEPRRVPAPPGATPKGLQELYRFRAYMFDSPCSEDHVAMLVGFPRQNDPLVYGFGCRSSGGAAVEVASAECVQRLGFLAGEPLPDASPARAPTPDFHQEHYLYPRNHDRLRRWLRGEHARHRGCLDPSLPRAPDEPRFVDLTPRELQGRAFVVRAVARGHVPLAFGVGHPLLGSNAPDAVAVHPVA